MLVIYAFSCTAAICHSLYCIRRTFSVSGFPLPPCPSPTFFHILFHFTRPFSLIPVLRNRKKWIFSIKVPKLFTFLFLSDLHWFSIPMHIFNEFGWYPFGFCVHFFRSQITVMEPSSCELGDAAGDCYVSSHYSFCSSINACSFQRNSFFLLLPSQTPRDTSLSHYVQQNHQRCIC